MIQVCLTIHEGVPLLFSGDFASTVAFCLVLVTASLLYIPEFSGCALTHITSAAESLWYPGGLDRLWYLMAKLVQQDTKPVDKALLQWGLCRTGELAASSRRALSCETRPRIL